MPGMIERIAGRVAKELDIEIQIVFAHGKVILGQAFDPQAKPAPLCRREILHGRAQRARALAVAILIQAREEPDASADSILFFPQRSVRRVATEFEIER